MSGKCGCASGTCQGCACSKNGRACSAACHGGNENLQCLNIHLKSGIDVLSMPAAKVKAEVIKRGLFNLDHTGPQQKALLLRALSVEESHSSGGGGGGDDDGDETMGSKDEIDPVAVAKKILEYAGDDLSILNVLNNNFPEVAKSKGLSTKQITAFTPAGEVKKLFRFLASHVHPDKLQRKFDKATVAFQNLVAAYDHLCQGAIAADLNKPRSSSAIDLTLTRSNANCFVTPVRCPRCDVEWNTPQDGLEKIAYTIFMTGLQSFCCSTCLLDFGCITAIHRCPHCKSKASNYDYSPEDFNRQIACVNSKCGKKFGFHLTVIPERRMKELKETLKETQEKRAVAQAAHAARMERMNKRKSVETPAVSSKKGKSTSAEVEDEQPKKKSKITSFSASLSEKDRAFLLGLENSCPRCGFTPEGNVKESTLEEHLRNCNDKAAHEAHSRKEKAWLEKKERESAKREKEMDSQSGQVWRFLGAQKENSWLLTEGAVKNQLRLKGEDVSDSAAKNLSKLVGRTQLQLNAGSSSSSAAASVGKDALVLHTTANNASSSRSSTTAAAAPTFASLPSNLHSLSVPRIIAVLAAHDMLRGDEEKVSKDRLIERIEARRDGRDEESLPDEEDADVQHIEVDAKQGGKSKATATPAPSSKPALTTATSSSASTLDDSISRILKQTDADKVSLNMVLGALAKEYSWTDEQKADKRKEVKAIVLKHLDEE